MLGVSNLICPPKAGQTTFDGTAAHNLGIEKQARETAIASLKEITARHTSPLSLKALSQAHSTDMLVQALSQAGLTESLKAIGLNKTIDVISRLMALKEVTKTDQGPEVLASLEEIADTKGLLYRSGDEPFFPQCEAFRILLTTTAKPRAIQKLIEFSQLIKRFHGGIEYTDREIAKALLNTEERSRALNILLEIADKSYVRSQALEILMGPEVGTEVREQALDIIRKHADGDLKYAFSFLSLLLDQELVTTLKPRINDTREVQWHRFEMIKILLKTSAKAEMIKALIAILKDDKHLSNKLNAAKLLLETDLLTDLSPEVIENISEIASTLSSKIPEIMQTLQSDNMFTSQNPSKVKEEWMESVTVIRILTSMNEETTAVTYFIESLKQIVEHSSDYCKYELYDLLALRLLLNTTDRAYAIQKLKDLSIHRVYSHPSAIVEIYIEQLARANLIDALQAIAASSGKAKFLAIKALLNTSARPIAISMLQEIVNKPDLGVGMRLQAIDLLISTIAEDKTTSTQPSSTASALAAEEARLEREKAEADRLEREREKARLETEAKAQEERDRLAAEAARLEREKAETARLAAEAARLEREKAEADSLAANTSALGSIATATAPVPAIPKAQAERPSTPSTNQKRSSALGSIAAASVPAAPQPPAATSTTVASTADATAAAVSKKPWTGNFADSLKPSSNPHQQPAAAAARQEPTAAPTNTIRMTSRAPGDTQRPKHNSTRSEAAAPAAAPANTPAKKASRWRNLFFGGSSE